MEPADLHDVTRPPATAVIAEAAAFLADPVA